ncbi:hypothetical protein ALC57_05546 [Trachymyrmex cornetzi]|uniref:Uncharacterized protein n=1 Tax=Trachymyrmex cornetzi TaxID=471704 RepID=A0A151JAG7_9HYME|nr:hypothetical protein ALC57_05546 [Trachymyrmex cornetzi]
MIEFIKDFEYNFFRYKIPNIKELRNKVFPLLKNINNSTYTDIEKSILSLYSETKVFCNNNPQIIFTNADKGNVVVACDKVDYIRDMELLFSDSQTYTLLKRNPVNTIISDLLSLLKCWKRHELISDSTYKYLYSSNKILPRAYGLKKIHKVGFPLRVIVSSTGSPLHNLASFLHKILHNSLPRAKSCVDNSYQLINVTKSITVLGQTCRQLKSRITEHKNHIRWNTSVRNVITEHRLQEGHDFDWNSVAILDEKPHYRKRLISEMIFIRRQTHGLNLQTDMEGLPKAYLPIIDKL